MWWPYRRTKTGKYESLAHVELPSNCSNLKKRLNTKWKLKATPLMQMFLI